MVDHLGRANREPSSYPLHWRGELALTARGQATPPGCRHSQQTTAGPHFRLTHRRRRLPASRPPRPASAVAARTGVDPRSRTGPGRARNGVSGSRARAPVSLTTVFGTAAGIRREPSKRCRTTRVRYQRLLPMNGGGLCDTNSRAALPRPATFPILGELFTWNGERPTPCWGTPVDAGSSSRRILPPSGHEL